MTFKRVFLLSVFVFFAGNFFYLVIWRESKRPPMAPLLGPGSMARSRSPGRTAASGGPGFPPASAPGQPCSVVSVWGEVSGL